MEARRAGRHGETSCFGETQPGTRAADRAADRAVDTRQGECKHMPSEREVERTVRRTLGRRDVRVRIAGLALLDRFVRRHDTASASPG